MTIYLYCLFGIFLLFAGFPTHGQPSNTEATHIAKQVASQTAWIAEAKFCPAQIFPVREAPEHFIHNHCTQGKLAQCFSSCSNNDAHSCYWLGQELMKAKAEPTVVEALFQRSCKLGVISGCTNRAAVMLVDKPKNPETTACALRTFSKGCDSNDPWACTMYAMHVGLGEGVPRDTAAALKALEKSCKYGITDEACSTGMRLKEMLQSPAPPAKK